MKLKISLFIIAIGSMLNPECLADEGTGESAAGSLSSEPPDTITLFSPIDFSQDVPVDAELSWHKQIHSSFYHLQLSTMPDFSDLLIDQVNLTDTIYSTADLSISTTHYWRVSAINVAGEGAFSKMWVFTTSHDPAVGSGNGSIADVKDLFTAFPNPFSKQTNIRIRGFPNQEISVMIVSSNGKCIWKMMEYEHQNGAYEIRWDGCDQNGNRVDEGLYLVVLQTGEHLIYRKIIKIE